MLRLTKPATPLLCVSLLLFSAGVTGSRVGASSRNSVFSAQYPKGVKNYVKYKKRAVKAIGRFFVRTILTYILARRKYMVIKYLIVWDLQHARSL